MGSTGRVAVPMEVLGGCVLVVWDERTRSRRMGDVAFTYGKPPQLGVVA